MMIPYPALNRQQLNISLAEKWIELLDIIMEKAFRNDQRITQIAIYSHSFRHFLLKPA
jgi:hypothetical protein